MRRSNILIVDDEPINLSMIADILKVQHNIFIATGGKKALDILRREHIDLILLDIVMPDMDGLEVADTINHDSQYHNVPFIFLTAQNTQQQIVKGFEAGAIDYIAKPYSKEELMARVGTHLKVHRLQHEIKQSQRRLQKLYDMQKNIVIVTDGQMLKIVNKSLLEFFGFDSLKTFQQHYSCICELFEPKEGFFHLDLVNEAETWSHAMIKLAPEKRVVSLKDQHGEDHAFSVSVNDFEDNEFIITFSDISSTIRLQQALQDETLHDPLTRAKNRKFFDTHINAILENAKGNIGLLMLDIDHFKRVNDTYGHLVGDTVLKTLVQVIKAPIRNQDHLIRWGGEEFLLIIDIDSTNDLLIAAENLRRNIEIYTFEAAKNITCSIGGKMHQRYHNVASTVQEADEALYRAKNEGRNHVVISS